MARYAPLLASLLGLALGQPWTGSWRSSAISPCYFSGDLCTCTNGTTFAVSHTTQTIGANAQDFKAVAGHFFKIDWEGLNVTGTRGIETIPGAERFATIPTVEGTYPVTETLDRYASSNDGGFAIYFNLGNAPIEYQDGSGAFGGYWVTYQAFYVTKNEVYIDWKINSCFTGSPFNFTEFKEGSLSNAISILTSQGKLTGKTFPAFTGAYP